MEPIGHEGLGRLLKLEGDLQTPHVVFSHSDLEESKDLESGGTITIGKKFNLPPSPLGLDSEKSPYLQLSENIAVIDNAHSIKPKKLVEIAKEFRSEAGYSRLLYAPAVEPSQMPILGYLGVDVFDDLNVELRSSTGWVLESGEWIKQNKQIEDLFSHNRAELNRWILRIRNAISNGKLRELVELTSLHNPRVSQILHHSTSLLVAKGARVHSIIRSNDLSLNHPAILDFQKDFFLSGDEAKLKPMILKDIAEMIDMDISTVSRVANSKHVSTPYGTFLLKYFFSESLTTDSGEEVSTREVKSILKEAVEKENKSKPLTDEKLALLLKEKGYLIARRTVAKYREQMHIPVARLRKQLV